MSVTLAELIDRVNLRLNNLAEVGNATVAGDGLATRFHIPDHYIDEGSLKVYRMVGTVATELTEQTAYEFDYLSSWLTYLPTVTLTSSEGLNFTYRYRHWPLQLVREVLNEGLSFLYPEFYCITTLTLTASSGVSTYALPHDEPIAGVLDVDWTESDSPVRLRPFYEYRVVRGESEAASLRLLFSASSGTLTVRVATRPVSFSSDDHTLERLGLPERMANCLIYYACWQLLNQKIAPRVRIDSVTPMQTEGMATFRDQLQASQYYKLMLDLELQKTRMRRWSIRGL